MLHNLKLLNRFVRKILEQAADDVVFVVSAIDVHINLSAITAIEGHVADARLCRIKVTYGSRLGHDYGQRGEGSIQERQILDLKRSNYSAQIRFSGLDLLQVAR